MKRFLTIFIMVLCLLNTTGCSTLQKEKNIENSQTDTTQQTEDNNAVIIYTMQVSKNITNNITPPRLSLDENNKIFTFSYDCLSSYLPFGEYEVKDNVLIATTNDKNYKYKFKIIGGNTLVFMQEDSSKIKYIDANIGIDIKDGTEFKTE